MKRFILILQLLTRITIKPDLPYDDRLNKGIVFFPLVGGILGLTLVLLYKTLNHVSYPIYPLIIVICYIYLTGGLHLDGLGDTFDGLYSNRSKEKILDIMKDSRLGTNGVIAILLILLIKVMGLEKLPMEEVYFILFYIPILGRMAIVLGCYKVEYAREAGFGHTFINRITLKDVLISILITIVLAAFHIKTLLFLPILVAFSHWYKGHVKKKIQGMTGDTLGALCELVEVLYILYMLFY